MRWPGRIPAGLRITEPVSLVDVAPTVLDLLGLPPLPGADGTSLAPLLTGAADRLPRDGVYTEAASKKGLSATDLTAVRTRSHTCIHRPPGAYECFDRLRDPGERAPLPPRPGDDGVRRAKASLDAFRSRTVTREPVSLPTGVLGPDVEAKLRDLGYIE
jgi:arylsulfatase A-like enzyme